jgi:hypothetical protein
MIWGSHRMLYLIFIHLEARQGFYIGTGCVTDMEKNCRFNITLLNVAGKHFVMMPVCLLR